MNRNRFFSSAAGLTIISLTTLASAPSAWAQNRQLSIEASEQDGYARILMSWADGSENGPSLTADMTGPVLILRFDEPVALDLDKLKDDLPSQIAIARQSDDGREVRIALAREYKAHVSNSWDLTAIDLVSEDRDTDPPDIVSPVVARKAAEAQAAAEAAEAARLANLPPPLALTIQGSQNDAYSTLAFYWPENVGFETSTTDEGFRIEFDRRGITDLTRTKIDPPRGLRGIDGENTDETFVVDLDLSDGHWANAIAVDNSVLVRIREGEAPDDLPEEDAAIPEALQALAETLGPAEPEGVEPPSRKPPLETLASYQAENPSPEPDIDTQADAAIEAVTEPPPSVRFVEEPEALPPITEARIWSEALPRSGTVPVAVTPGGRGIGLELKFASDIPGVVFRRNNAVWMAFPANGSFDLSGLEQSTGVRIDQVRSDTGMALRVFLPTDLLLQIESDGRNWRLEAGNEGELADHQVKLKRIASNGGSGIEAIVREAGTVFSLTDPEIGDELIFVSAADPSTTLAQSLSFIDAELPVTSHGLVVIPKADDVNVVQRGDNIRISRDSGLALSSWGVDSALAGQGGISPGFLDFASWRLGSERDFWRNQTRLAAAAARADPETWEGQDALMNLAKFYLAWEYAAEAYGPLNIAQSADPLLEQDAQWRTLRGAADIMMGRYEDAIKTLEHGNVRGDPAAASWLGLAYAEIGDWRKSREAFILAEPLINAHSPEWAARFHAAASRAMIRMGDGGNAEAHALAAARGEDEKAAGHASLTLGEMAVATNRFDDARAIYQRLMGHSDPNVRVRAQLEAIKLAVDEGKISHLDASDQLDMLRFRWRGDQLELEIVAELADSYFELGRFREALTLAKNFAEQFPNLPGARDLRIKLAEQFESLFLEGKADSLDPISALALFYEFRELTPIGPDGDRMIRMLSNRLVAFDLLDPATELLSHQVENRNLIGQSRAQIASDLAAIYLMDRRPEKALQSLNATRIAGLSDELRIERRLLEAAAHMELGRYGHAIELLETLENQRGRDLLAEVHWRARTWGAAGRALQRTLPPPGQRLTGAQLQTAVRAAVAYRLDGDLEGLSNLRSAYLDSVRGTEEDSTFDLLTSTNDVSTARLTDTIRRMADTTTANAFLTNLKQRFSRAGGAP
ncbi:MAG: hypothetical protein CMK09_06005 [Ponticaulis sp.]|nr:hypothetical protein [Ponticaulis sp.]|tara:strand:- start:26009 stop:29455 length:3447 start_codon:yes stop_codon:yes gene_type:complete